MVYLYCILSLLVFVAGGIIYIQRKNIFRLKKELDGSVKKYQELVSERRRRHDFKIKLISMLTHDFCGTFRNIISLMELYQNRDIPEESFAVLFEELKSTSRNNLDAFERTLKWVKTQIDGYKYCPEPVSISQAINDAVKCNRSEFRRKEISVSVKGDKEAKMLADIQLMRFVLNSIINNGVKFSHRGGVIECEIRKQNDNRIQVHIADSGIGMDAKTLNALFSPDKTLYNGTLGEKGAGIALLICKDFVEIQRSKLDAVSRKGKGSVFILTVPGA